MDKTTLHKLSYGVYIVCAKNKEKLNGQIANSLFQVTSEPPTIAVSINKQNLTHQCIDACRTFTVSILDKNTPLPFIGNFGFKSGRDIDKFKNVAYRMSKTNNPVVTEHAVGYLEAVVCDKLDVGTHTIFVGTVTDAQKLADGDPMTYEYYHKVKGGYSPKTAPTYESESDQRKKKPTEEKKMDSYVCSVCGYVYDPQQGDPDNGIEPGTAFENLPDVWVCPVCGAGKEAFEKQ
ncbi:MAG TPA: flavin reductase [Candidatus Thermoplasmatota archaeon]|nr:flavin reductase [Candidatus Thermoplasmatota archaeon]